MAYPPILVIRLAASNRLRIEMLRAHMPSKFKTPGSGQPLIAGDNNQVMIMTEARQNELIRLRREALEAMNPKPVTGQMAGQLDSGNSPASVQ